MIAVYAKFKVLNISEYKNLIQQALKLLVQKEQKQFRNTLNKIKSFKFEIQVD